MGFQTPILTRYLEDSGRLGKCLSEWFPQDARLLDAEKKLEQLAKGIGAQERSGMKNAWIHGKTGENMTWIYANHAGVWWKNISFQNIGDW